MDSSQTSTGQNKPKKCKYCQLVVEHPEFEGMCTPHKIKYNELLIFVRKLPLQLVKDVIAKVEKEDKEENKSQS